MNDVAEYLTAAQEFAKAQKKVHEFYRLVSQVHFSLDASRCFDFAKRQAGDRLVVASPYSPKEQYADWPSESELLEALKSYREAAEKALDLFNKIPAESRAGLKRIDPSGKP